MASGTIPRTPTIPSGFVLLWTNSDPTSAFSAQSVPVDLSSYDAVYIQFKYGTSATSWRTGMFALVDGNNYQAICMGDLTASSASIITARYFDVLTTGINFEGGLTKKTTSTSAASSSNGSCIPYQIYGIKF